MTEYHVGCGNFGIYAGILKKDNEWRNKSDVTHEALCAVAQYLLFQGKEFRFQHKDKWYVMRIEEFDETSMRGEQDERVIYTGDNGRNV